MADAEGPRAGAPSASHEDGDVSSRSSSDDDSQPALELSEEDGMAIMELESRLEQNPYSYDLHAQVCRDGGRVRG